MKRSKISANVIRRLPRYLRQLDDLLYRSVDRVSSAELGEMMSLTPSQIRQDFSCFGEFGQQGYGYNVQALRDAIAAILGMKRGGTAILVGVGNLGHALIENFGFQDYGFTLLAAFDTKSATVGANVGSTVIRHADELPDFLAHNPVDLAVLTVPRRAANDTARLLAKHGIRAIWNFTNVELELDSQEILLENVHFSDSLLTLSYYLGELKDDHPEDLI